MTWGLGRACAVAWLLVWAASSLLIAQLGAVCFSCSYDFCMYPHGLRTMPVLS